MGTSLRVVVKPEGVEATQAAIQAIARSAAASTREATASMSSAAVTHADAMEHRYAKASLRITEAMGRVADSGNLAGGGMGKVLAIGSEMAFMFGTTGPIVGAIGVAALTITRFFMTAREESDKTKKKLQDDVASLVNSGNFSGVQSRLRDLMAGTPGNRYQDGIAASDAKISGFESNRNPLTSAIIDGMIKRELEKTKALRDEARLLRDAILNPAGAAGGTGGLQPARIEAKRGPGDAIPPMEVMSEKEIVAQLGRALREQAEARNPAWSSQGAVDLTKMADEFAGQANDAFVKSVSMMFDGPEGAKVWKGITASIKASMKLVKWTEIKSELGKGIADAVGGGVAAGLATAISSGNLASAFQHLGGFITSQLGQILADVALKAIGFATMMAKFETWLIANPWAAIGIGVAMLALANSFKGSGVGAGGGGFGGSYSGGYGSAVGAAETHRVIWGGDSATTAAGMTPRQAVNVTIIGPNDPSAQRQLIEIINKASRRG